jgi:hypothetical protein
MKAYASDVWAKMAQACDDGAASRRQLAPQCRVRVACIQQLPRRRRLTGRLAAAPHTGGRRGVLDADALGLVARLIREPNDLPWAERCARARRLNAGCGSVSRRCPARGAASGCRTTKAHACRRA